MKPIPRERALVPYLQRMIYLGSRRGPSYDLPAEPGVIRVREVQHFWVSDLALRALKVSR